MPENILVIEYEPRYIDKARTALSGPFEPAVVHDGEEAVRALDTLKPALVVLSSMVPKATTSGLIQAIRQRSHLQQTPILLTVSGYHGSNPKQDAVRVGATDLLPKPYTEADLLAKVQAMLGTARPFTSEQIFGDLLEEKAAAAPAAPKRTGAKDDLDKLLADTLSGVMTAKKPAAPPPKAKTQPGSAQLDKLLSELTTRQKTASGSIAVPPAPPQPPVQEDNVSVSVPLLSKQAPPPPVEEEEPADGQRFGQYVLLEKIATGGMAEVWKARMRGVEGFQKIVAIKKILPHLSDNQDFIEMFVDEAKLAAQLNHNNIIHIYDLGKIQNSYYIAMEYIDGSDLKTILREAQERDVPLSIELSLFVASKVASALDYAHRKRDFENKDLGLVHRDVSPQNVLISKEGDIKLCDFGIAKAASKASHTQTGALKGKLQYMSPEQAWGKAIDRRSDVFALATVLFEMLAGRQLFTGENEISILEQVREARVVPPSKFNEDVTPEIDRVVLKALQREPAERYETAGEMARDLDSILYEFKPTPSMADLAIYMHRLETTPAVPAPVAEPEPPPPPPPPPSPKSVETRLPSRPPTLSGAPAPPGVVMPSWESTAAARKRSNAVPIAIGTILLAGAAVGGYFVWQRRAAPAGGAAQARPVAATPAPQPVVTQSVPAALQTATVPFTDTAPAAAALPPAVDTARVDAEVQRRLAAERAKFEQQLRAQEQAAAPAPAPVRRPPEPVPQPAAPQPAVVDTRPAPVPVPVPQPAPEPVAPAPAPAPAPQPAEPRVREGDLVASGTEDVVAKMTRRANIPYPPMARMQRVEGTVLISALISETGRVLDVKLIRPINRAVGLNEAAEEIVRRSTFSPPMKNGVRVKAWTTVPVEFKL